ncbi:MAG: hypothetical protein AVDCRST_MAG52-2726, partial [uncultured Blastococcus sp.]
GGAGSGRARSFRTASPTAASGSPVPHEHLPGHGRRPPPQPL